MPIHDFESRIRGEVGRIESSDNLTDKDVEILLRYKRDMEVQGLSDSRIYKVLYQTRKLAEQLDERSLADATKEDVKDLVAWVRRRDLAESTRSDYLKMIKRFFRWQNQGEYPAKVQWIKTTMKQKDGKLPEKLLDEDDVGLLIAEARNPRNRALISLMWETGARPGEYLDLRVGDIEDRENGKKVVVDGKTGPRRLPLVESSPHLSAWLSQHPGRGDREAFLWCKLNGDGGESIDYDYFRNLLREIAERAGVEKPMYPYQFRHSRATYLANWLTEAQMCQYFGWVQGSDRPSTYVHLSGRDIDLAYDRMHGLAEEDEERSKLSPAQCPRCRELVGARAKFCGRCGLPLDAEVAQRLQEDEEIAESFYDEGVEGKGGLKELVERMVEKRLKEILGENYRR